MHVLDAAYAPWFVLMVYLLCRTKKRRLLIKMTALSAGPVPLIARQRPFVCPPGSDVPPTSFRPGLKAKKQLPAATSAAVKRTGLKANKEPVAVTSLVAEGFDQNKIIHLLWYKLFRLAPAINPFGSSPPFEKGSMLGSNFEEHLSICWEKQVFFCFRENFQNQIRKDSLASSLQ